MSRLDDRVPAEWLARIDASLATQPLPTHAQVDVLARVLLDRT